jgi:hypothetical protein
MSYRILIGISVALDKGELWKGKAGKVVKETGEVRFEPGDEVKEFPRLTDMRSLLDIQAVEVIEEELENG